MKRLLLCLLIPLSAFGAAGDIKISYKSANNVSWIDAIFAKQNSAIIGTSSTGIPQIATDANLPGNLTFTGTGQFIRGDFSNATLTNRVYFQTSTANSPTNIGVIANGTATASSLVLNGSSDPLNTARLALTGGSTGSIINSTKLGTGTTQPIYLQIDGANAIVVGLDISSTFTGEIINNVLHVTGTSNLVKTGDTNLADIPGLTVNVIAGGKYNFDADIQMSATTTGGFRTVLAGTAVMSDVRLTDVMTYGAAGGVAEVSTTAVASLNAGNTRPSTGTNTGGSSHFHGSLTVGTGGTLKIQFCQNNNAGASTAYAESTMDLWRTQ